MTNEEIYEDEIIQFYLAIYELEKMVLRRNPIYQDSKHRGIRHILSRMGVSVIDKRRD